MSQFKNRLRDRRISVFSGSQSSTRMCASERVEDSNHATCYVYTIIGADRSNEQPFITNTTISLDEVFIKFSGTNSIFF